MILSFYDEKFIKAKLGKKDNIRLFPLGAAMLISI
jgi:hypothetical protein